MSAVRRARRLSGGIILLSIVSLLAACSGSAEPGTAQEGAEADVVSGQVIVKFRPGTGEQSIATVLEQSGARIERPLGAAGTYLLRFDERTPVARMIERLRRYPEVEYAEPNRIIRLDPPPPWPTPLPRH